LRSIFAPIVCIMTPKERLAKIKEELQVLDEPGRSVFIALGEFQSGLPVEHLCPFCHSTIRVWFPNPRNTQAWQVACDCGKCNDTIRGL
jgi:hypothetical protein